MSSVLLNPGAELVSFEDLAELATPERTATHVPLPHFELVNMVKYALGYFGHEVAEEHHAVTPEAARYFGLLTLRSTYGSYTDTVGLRNSHDKRFPIGIAFGSRVFVCSNLAFSGEHVIRRKHTANSKRDLPGLVAGIVEPLKEERLVQHRVIERYQATELSDELADLTIMQLYREGVINVTRIAEVVREWDEPSFAEFQTERTAWRLFNAATFALNGRMLEDAQASRRLHTVIDGACERVH